MAWPKDPAINHTVSINYMAGPKVSGTQKQSYQAADSKELKLISQEPVKS